MFCGAPVCGGNCAASGSCVPTRVLCNFQVSRRESARITLHGNAEFEASDVTLTGDCEFDVPAGRRMRVVAGQGGTPRVSTGPSA
jgi:hypothetical protein